MMEKYTAIIIDDMELARISLRKDLAENCPQLSLIGEAEGVVSGAKLFHKTNPDIVFLDIQMQDGNGFDLLEIIPNTHTKIIFVTASDEYAIKAFQYAAVDYLLKPVGLDLLKASVSKALAGLPTHRDQVSLLQNQMSGLEKPLKLALHTAEKIQIVNIHDINRLESDGNYTVFHFTDGTKLMITRTLKEYDKILNDHGYIRVHQSHLVNTKKIKAYIKTEGGYLVMADDTRVPVSVRKKSYVVEMMDKIAKR